MRTHKAAIIGLGLVAPMHINSLNAIGTEITAVCDNDYGQVKKAGLDCPAFSDCKEMLAAGGFDTLHICLPHYLHAPVAIAALEKGIHVLCEKPMATTVSDAEKMIKASEKSGAKLGVIFQNRYNPGTLLIKEALESGELGAVISGRLRVHWHRTEDYYTKSGWRGKWATEGGGVVINQSVHTFDLANFLLGDPVDTDASIGNLAHPSIEVEDIAEGVITYGSIPVTFSVKTCHHCDDPAEIVFVCENGSAEISGENAEIIFNDGRKKTAGADIEAQRKFGMKSYWGVSHVKQIQAFYDALEKGQNPQPDGKEALRTQKLVNAIYESAKTGKKVCLQNIF